MSYGCREHRTGRSYQCADCATGDRRDVLAGRITLVLGLTTAVSLTLAATVSGAGLLVTGPAPSRLGPWLVAALAIAFGIASFAWYVQGWTAGLLVCIATVPVAALFSWRLLDHPQGLLWIGPFGALVGVSGLQLFGAGLAIAMERWPR